MNWLPQQNDINDLINDSQNDHSIVAEKKINDFNDFSNYNTLLSNGYGGQFDETLIKQDKLSYNHGIHKDPRDIGETIHNQVYHMNKNFNQQYKEIKIQKIDKFMQNKATDLRIIQQNENFEPSYFEGKIRVDYSGNYNNIKDAFHKHIQKDENKLINNNTQKNQNLSDVLYNNCTNKNENNVISNAHYCEKTKKIANCCEDPSQECRKNMLKARNIRKANDKIRKKRNVTMDSGYNKKIVKLDNSQYLTNNSNNSELKVNENVNTNGNGTNRKSQFLNSSPTVSQQFIKSDSQSNDGGQGMIMKEYQQYSQPNRGQQLPSKKYPETVRWKNNNMVSSNHMVYANNVRGSINQTRSMDISQRYSVQNQQTNRFLTDGNYFQEMYLQRNKENEMYKYNLNSNQNMNIQQNNNYTRNNFLNNNIQYRYGMNQYMRQNDGNQNMQNFNKYYNQPFISEPDLKNEPEEDLTKIDIFPYLAQNSVMNIPGNQCYGVPIQRQNGQFMRSGAMSNNQRYYVQNQNQNYPEIMQSYVNNNHFDVMNNFPSVRHERSVNRN
ncbi:hypothetical protein A3Q56_07772 [Intoshia linei]|uniref:Uncharacterized protein n=1 Tax=Intoshia linei TaxID=1819745 RepID=A0A177ASK9_9BILA|nr:hypothetical protein A3Q56_07772 [Intoshia linei]